jgi:hypothetical protein
MGRLMSVAYTEQAVRERRKTVTRRLGWLFAKPGDRITLCRKVMGRKPGEPLERIVDVEIIDVRRERLDDITAGDIIREGFASPAGYAADRARFIDLFRESMRATPETVVTRIEWRYLDSSHPTDPIGGAR